MELWLRHGVAFSDAPLTTVADSEKAPEDYLLRKRLYLYAALLASRVFKLCFCTEYLDCTKRYEGYPIDRVDLISPERRRSRIFWLRLQLYCAPDSDRMERTSEANSRRLLPIRLRHSSYLRVKPSITSGRIATGIE